MLVRFVCVFCLVCAFNQAATTTHADVVVKFLEVGADTKVEVSGTINFTDWGNGAATFASGMWLQSDLSSISSVSIPFDVYARSDPGGTFTPFGSAPEQSFVATPDPGFTIGFVDGAFLDLLLLPDEYVSGSEIDIDHTFTGQSFGDFGLTDGDVWGVEFPVYDSNGNQTGATQRMTFSAAVVPEPGSAAGLAMLGCVFLTNLRRRK